MNIWEAVILAIIEGITEFLPISSTGHMIIASSFMGIASESFTKTFTVAIQLGAILSVIVLYWKRFLQTLSFYYKLLIAFAPAAILGLLFGKLVDQFLDRVDVVGFALLAGGIVLLFVDNWFKKNESVESSEVTYTQSLIIGLFQCIAMFFPGVSRSAATIVGGLSQKLNRKTAAEFSFFLAVPTMFAATSYKLLQFFLDGNTLQPKDTTNLIVGNVIAFVVAWIAIRSFINFLTKNGFKVFGYYRIFLGIVLLVLYYSGYEFGML